MTPSQIGIRVAASVGIALIVAALVYALSNGRAFLFPFLLVLGLPLVTIFTRRPPGPPKPPLPPFPPQSPPRISLN